MNQALLILTLLLVALEYLFWLSPAKARLDAWSDQLGGWYLLLPIHYWLRLGALGIVLFWYGAPNWPVFAGGTAWWYSLLLGLGLSLLSAAAGHWLKLYAWPAVRGGAARWLKQNPVGMLKHTAYITVYPGGVEELIFRWFYMAALWPALGWWTLLGAPLVNLVWHLPVWWAMVAGQEQSRRLPLLLSVAIPATILAVLLSGITALTQNLLGAVLAHAVGDILGSAARYRGNTQASAA